VSDSGTGRGRLRGAGEARRLTHPLLEAIPGLAHGFTVRGADLGAAIRDAAGRTLPLHTARQVHGDGLHSIEVDGPPATPPVEADALLTARRGAALAVQVADCVPILVADRAAGLIAAVHAGWRGTVAGVLARTLDAFASRGSHGADLTVVLGPHIGRCCFEVGPEVVEAFRRARPDAESAILESSPKPHLDLEEANRRQAQAAGVPPGAIGAIGLCTVCRPDLLESYRRSRGSPGRMSGFIAWSG
jgi:YfiH family protein